MATHSNILTWEIPWTEEPGWLQSMELQGLDTTYQLNHQSSSVFNFFRNLHTIFCSDCFFSSNTLNISFYSLLDSKVSAVIPNYSLMGVLLYVRIFLLPL